MAYIRKLKGSLVKLDFNDYVGEAGYLFHDIESGCLRLSDGVTPNGLPLCNGQYDGGLPSTGDVQIDPISSGNHIIDADVAPAATNLSIKWLYTIKDLTNGTILSSEVLANHAFGTKPRWQRYSVIGDIIPHTIEVVLEDNPLNVKLRVTNPTNNTYIITVVRIPVR